jgi:hypothetical protein
MGVIDKLPTFDDGKLDAIERNARRLMSSGTDAQRAEAESVVEAIAAERERRLAEVLSGEARGNEPDGGLSTTGAGQHGFPTIWMKIVQQLNSGDTIRNWGKDRGYTGGTFRIEDVGNSAITITGGSTSHSRRISKTDFENVYAVWGEYCAGNYPRGKMTDLSQNTTYILSILRRVTAG